MAGNWHFQETGTKFKHKYTHRGVVYEYNHACELAEMLVKHSGGKAVENPFDPDQPEYDEFDLAVDNAGGTLDVL